MTTTPYAIAIGFIAAATVFGLLNFALIGIRTVERNHYRRDRDWWRKQATYWQAQAGEHVETLRRGGAI